MYCAVVECGNSMKGPDSKLGFWAPTTNRRLCEKWCIAMRRDPRSSLWFRVCEDHFILEKDCANYLEYRLMKGVKLRLKPGAVPSQFPWLKGRCSTSQKEVQDPLAIEESQPAAQDNIEQQEIVVKIEKPDDYEEPWAIKSQEIGAEEEQFNWEMDAQEAKALQGGIVDVKLEPPEEAEEPEPSKEAEEPEPPEEAEEPEPSEKAEEPEPPEEAEELEEPLIQCGVCHEITLKCNAVKLNEPNGTFKDLGVVLDKILKVTDTLPVSDFCCKSCRKKVLQCFYKIIDINVLATLGARKCTQTERNVEDEQVYCPGCFRFVPSLAVYRTHLMRHMFSEAKNINNRALRRASYAQSAQDDCMNGSMVIASPICAPPRLPPPPPPTLITSEYQRKIGEMKCSLNSQQLSEHCYGILQQDQPSVSSGVQCGAEEKRSKKRKNPRPKAGRSEVVCVKCGVYVKGRDIENHMESSHGASKDDFSEISFDPEPEPDRSAESPSNVEKQEQEKPGNPRCLQERVPILNKPGRVLDVLNQMPIQKPHTNTRRNWPCKSCVFSSCPHDEEDEEWVPDRKESVASASEENSGDSSEDSDSSVEVRRQKRKKMKRTPKQNLNSQSGQT